jgi:acetyltransferase AlgX (SGNH hydrolase-like protein)
MLPRSRRLSRARHERDGSAIMRSRRDVPRSPTCGWLAVVADVGFVVAALLLLYTALGGEIRWGTALFRITLTEPKRPIQACVLILLVKAIAGLDQGLFAALATTGIPMVAPVAALLHVLDRRLRAWVLAYRVPLLVSAGSLALSLTVLELGLRSFAPALPHALANHLTTRYHTGPSGIYRYAPELHMNLMRPNDDRVLYFNGYRWRHQTDSRGFRNPVERERASVILLGDSIVYGHGVEETSTIRSHLEAILGQPVANLGRQGSSIHDEYQTLRAFGVDLRPRHVFVFFLANDIDDLGLLTRDEMSAFLETPVTDHVTPYFRIRPPRVRPWYTEWSETLETRVDELYVVKALDFLWRSLTGARGTAEAAEDVLATLPPLPRGPKGALPMRFHLHALQKMQALADSHHFQLVVVFTYTGAIAEELAYEKILEAFCRTARIAFLSLRPAFTSPTRSFETLFLRGDGHLSDAGARLAAEEVARYVAQHPERGSAPRGGTPAGESAAAGRPPGWRRAGAERVQSAVWP